MSSPLSPNNPVGQPFGTTPTVAVVAAAGTTATATVGAGSTDQRGTITVNSAGTGQAAGAVATVTFGKTPGIAPPLVVALTPANANAGAIGDFVTNITATTFQIGVATALTAGQAYIFEYQVIL